MCERVELMCTTIQLRSTVADFFEVPESQVDPSFSLAGRPSSVARAALDAAIRHRVGRVSRAVYSASTYGEIEAELFPEADKSKRQGDKETRRQGDKDNVDTSVSLSPCLPVSLSSPLSSGAGGAVSCGIDLELVENLPATADHWEEPFYRAHFAPGEIADCLRRESPAVHLAARWCVKEALKKCDRAFLTEEMSRIELIADDSGAPYLVFHKGGVTRRLPHAVSLSHTPHAAVAVVVKSAAPTTAAVPVPTPLPSGPPPVPRGRGWAPLWSLLLSLAALGLAALALYQSFLPKG
jgi:phosphopantetheine--protein transferase-like protein